MRNLYPLPGRGLTKQDFNLAVEYEAPGTPAVATLPGLSTPLLQVTGLDRLSSAGSPSPDNQFDFLEQVTIDPERGLLIYPYLEPFGTRIADVVTDAATRTRVVYRDLYLEKKEEAKRNTLLDVYRMRGKYQGSVQSFFDLRAFSGLIANSVKVRSGGIDLAENSDYSVDYTGGTVTITNPAYLRPGQNVEISYEQNQFFNQQKKTLLGLRADYDVRPGLQLGATLMRLSQRSAADKFRIGEEPVSNSIWGVDGRYEAKPRWITSALDRLPLLTTRAESRVAFTAEYAQLRPGNPQTLAFQQQRDVLRGDGDDFFRDELRRRLVHRRLRELREQLVAQNARRVGARLRPRLDPGGRLRGREPLGALRLAPHDVARRPRVVQPLARHLLAEPLRRLRPQRVRTAAPAARRLQSAREREQRRPLAAVPLDARPPLRPLVARSVQLHDRPAGLHQPAQEHVGRDDDAHPRHVHRLRPQERRVPRVRDAALHRPDRERGRRRRRALRRSRAHLGRRAARREGQLGGRPLAHVHPPGHADAVGPHPERHARPRHRHRERTHRRSRPRRPRVVDAGQLRGGVPGDDVLLEIRRQPAAGIDRQQRPRRRSRAGAPRPLRRRLPPLPRRDLLQGPRPLRQPRRALVAGGLPPAALPPVLPRPRAQHVHRAAHARPGVGLEDRQLGDAEQRGPQPERRHEHRERVLPVPHPAQRRASARARRARAHRRLRDRRDEARQWLVPHSHPGARSDAARRRHHRLHQHGVDPPLDDRPPRARDDPLRRHRHRLVVLAEVRPRAHRAPDARPLPRRRALHRLVAQHRGEPDDLRDASGHRDDPHAHLDRRRRAERARGSARDAGRERARWAAARHRQDLLVAARPAPLLERAPVLAPRRRRRQRTPAHPERPRAGGPLRAPRLERDDRLLRVRAAAHAERRQHDRPRRALAHRRQRRQHPPLGPQPAQDRPRQPPHRERHDAPEPPRPPLLQPTRRRHARRRPARHRLRARRHAHRHPRQPVALARLDGRYRRALAGGLDEHDDAPLGGQRVGQRAARLRLRRDERMERHRQPGCGPRRPRQRPRQLPARHRRVRLARLVALRARQVVDVRPQRDRPVRARPLPARAHRLGLAAQPELRHAPRDAALHDRDAATSASTLSSTPLRSARPPTTGRRSPTPSARRCAAPNSTPRSARATSARCRSR